MAWLDKEFEEKMSPCIDGIYKGLFSGLCKIDRSSTNNAKNLMLDKDLAIDSILYFKDGTILTFQEKTRKNFYYQKYNEFTFEYYNDQSKSDLGEWFKLASQFYFYGFANTEEDAYSSYHILNVPNLRLFLKNEVGINELCSKRLRGNIPPNKANFFGIPFSMFPEKCILHKSI